VRLVGLPRLVVLVVVVVVFEEAKRKASNW
jgi:hypothetical protein